MKRSLIVAALATVAAGTSFAQSSVTIYGRLNDSVERQKTGDNSIYALQNNSSRIGFKGVEDLGGGLKAGFQLEHGFNADNGKQSQTAFWARQSEVFLQSAELGTLRLGNFTAESYYATADYVSMHNHDTGTSSDALYQYVMRDTNKVAWRAPEFVKNLSLEAAVSAGEAAPGQEKAFDLAANYSAGNLALGAGFSKNKSDKQFAVRALYTLGDFTFGGYYQRAELGSSFQPLDGKVNIVRLSGMYAVGASEFHLNFGVAGKLDHIDDTDSRQATVAYNYNLSKRTKLYAFYTKVDNKALATYATGQAGVDFSSIAAGIRHNF
ncbi:MULTISPECIES: porin [unclassified Rhizobacter]|uniref:porin n=1 Tax=unclassified Rhizobacter TaxID=2640088 RepID=UPI0006F2DD37|nr:MULTISPECIES: porin [unclassified Rhizobacter]KQU74625.1 porin [Rhizobacter sp. Root29]KQW13417.1 porin [Rhizobacter sp. Root1238]KRB23050.1 porin [Rhizobacter sp. Root16D2]